MRLTFYDVFYTAFRERGYPEWLADIKAKEWAADAERGARESHFKEALKNKGRKVYKPTIKKNEEVETLYDYLLYRGFKEGTARKIVSARGNLSMEKLEKENMVLKKGARKKGKR